MEVTQGVQRLVETEDEAFVDLYKGKPTTVRAYFTRSPEEAKGPHSPVLRGFVGGRELPSSPIRLKEAYNAPLAHPRNRHFAATSANFPLPDSWTAFDNLELVVDNIAANCAADCRHTVSFKPSLSALSIQFHPISWTDSLGTLHETGAAEFGKMARRVRAFVPDGYPAFFRGPTLRDVVTPERALDEETFTNLLFATGSLAYIRSAYLASWCSGGWLDGCGQLNNFISFAAAEDFVFYKTDQRTGLRLRDSFVAYVDVPPKSAGWPERTPEHELGHTLGPEHAPGGGTEDPNFPDSRYIVGGATLQFNPTLAPKAQALGWDTLLGRTPGMPPHEVMTYLSGRWVSDVHYAKMRSDIERRAEDPFESGDYLDPRKPTRFVRFLREGTSGDVRWYPVLTYFGMAAAAPQLDPGPYTIEFRYEDQVVASTNFDVIEVSQQDSNGTTDRAGLVGLQTESPVSSIVLFEDGVEIGRLEASASAPTIASVTATVEASSVTIDWESVDADGDALMSTILYRRDSGPWVPIAVDLPGQQYTADLADLGRAQDGQFRVVVSDGFDSSSSESWPVNIPGAAPSVTITSPQPAAQVDHGTTLSLQAFALDTEDGEINGAAVTWSSDADGTLGTGSSLTIPGARLTAGTRQLTVTAIDSDGLSATDTVAVEVRTVLETLEDKRPNGSPVRFTPEDWLLAGGLSIVDIGVANLGSAVFSEATLELVANGASLTGVEGDGWSCEIASLSDAVCRYNGSIPTFVTTPPLELALNVPAFDTGETSGIVGIDAVVTVAGDRAFNDDRMSLLFTVVDAPPPAEAGRLRGGVFDSTSSEPIEAARVILRGGPGGQEFTTTDSAGVFDFFNVSPGEWVLEVRADGYPTDIFFVALDSGETLAVDLPLSRDIRPVSLGGLVVDAASNTGIAGALVELTSLSGTAFSAVADGTGAFSMSAIPPGGYQLSATATGFRPSQASVALDPNRTFEVEIPLESNQVPAIELGGTVVDAGTGQALDGITVDVEAPGSSAQTQTDSAGAFSVTLDQSEFGLDRVTTAVTFGGPGYRTLATEVTLVSGATNLINASLAREAPTTITGRVSDSRTSRSLVGARVSLVTDTEIGSALSDATGIYRIELDPDEPAPASASLVVELDGYETSTTQVSMSTGSTTLAGVALVAERPVNVNLAPSVSGPNDLSVGQQGRFHVQLFNIGSAEVPSGSAVEVTVLLPPFLTVVSTSGSSWTCQAATGGLSCVYNRRINPGSLSNELEIVASPLEGSVDQLGELTVSVDPAVGPTRSSDSHLVRALAAATPDFTLFLEPANRLIVPGASVSFQVLVVSIDGWTEPVGLVAEGLPPGFTATINPAIVVPNGTALLTVKAPSDAAPGPVNIDIVGVSNAIERRTSAAVELEFGLIPVCTGTVSGVVTDARTNQPVVGMTVKIGSSSVATDENGIYRLDAVPVGSSNQPRTYVVESPTTPDYWARFTPGVVVACDTETVADFAVLPRDYTIITGRVVEGVPDIEDPSRFRTVRPTTTPIEGATVSLSIPSANVSDGMQEAVTNSQGEFRFGRAPVDPIGPTRLQVSESGYWGETRTLYLSDGAEADLTIPLVYSCDGSARVRAVDAETGVPLANVWFRMFTVNPPYPSRLTDATGSAFFDELELGQRNSLKSYQVVLTGHELGPYDEITVTAPPTWVEVPSCGATGQADIPVTIVETPRPPDTVQVLGSIIDAKTGEPIPFAGMTFRRDGASFGESFSSGMDGTFVAELLPGRYFTSSGSFGFEPAYGEVEVVEPGPATAQLALEPNLGYVAGAVIDTLTGEPIPNAGIQRPGWSSRGSESDGSYVYPVVLRRDSTNEPFEVLEDLELSVRAAGYYNEIVEGIGPVQLGETLQRDLELFPIPDCEPATIRGRVINAETREPIEGADVGPTGRAPVQTDVDGRFEFQEDVSETFRIGTLRVTASKPGFVSASKDVTVWCGANITLDFGEPPTGTTSIAGTVTRADTGEPVEGAFVGAEFGAGATTRADGTYLIAEAPLGLADENREWVLAVDAPGPSGLVGASTTVTVSQGVQATVDFVLSVFGAGDGCPDDPNKTEPGACGCGVPDTDSDGDGVPDCNDGCVDDPTFDTDGDGIGDLCDPDDDNDGVVDAADNCPLIANPDQADNELDGIGDLCDPDDDNDGVSDDAPDNCQFTANPDQSDVDMDSLGDVCDGDVDGDLVDDEVDICPFDPDPGQEDTDGDLEGDACDDDDDNDGVLDAADNCVTVVNADQLDTDGDNLGNVCDADDDGDNVDDLSDNCPLAPNLQQLDNDLDGAGDVCDADDDNDGIEDASDNCPLVENITQLDSEGDGLGNACDADDDNDGIVDASDNCPLNANSDQQDNDTDGPGDACDADDDNDGVLDAEDNCVFTPNPDQWDSDWDGLGDVCDDDQDGDDVLNLFDNCPEHPNAGQDDLDGDGLGDACDDDLDGDGVLNATDNCVFTFNPAQTDYEGDGLGDVCDADDDNDGVTDGVDNCPLVANPGQADFDGDGAGDVCDNDIDGDGVLSNDDVCEFTPAGELIDPSTGCSIGQLCPCEGPQGSSEPWKNHGKYVSCVTKAANDLKALGLITEEQKGQITAEAAQSACGQ
jgi:hypothetical protein